MSHGSGSLGSINTLDQAAEQFVQRIRDGEYPSIKEYKDAFPQFATDIDEMFPTLAELEQYNPHGESRPSSSVSSFQAPTRLGDYIIKREIGRGGMGVVYEAEHALMRRRVALKVLPSNNNPDYKKRFFREARAAGQLHHTNIVPVFEVDECQGVSYYAMQYIEGQNLDAVIEELKKFEQLEQNGQNPSRASIKKPAFKNSTAAPLDAGVKPSVALTTPLGSASDSATNDVTLAHGGAKRTEPRNEFAATQPLAPNDSSVTASGTSEWSQIGESGDSYFRRVARVGVQVADALQFAHDHGVLHRDIKPSNLILDTDGVVWITDFGLAKDNSDDLTNSGDIIGTLRYMAPERFQGDADVASEIYSLGLTLYELCTLQHAFDQTDRARLIQQVSSQDPVPPRRIRPSIPKDLETVIVKAISREPTRRYSSAQQMSLDLQRFLADRPVLARRVSVFEKIYRWGRRHPARASLVSCLALICLMITGGSIYLAELNNKHAVELRADNIRVLEEKAKADKALEDAVRASLGSRAHLYYNSLRAAEASISSGQQGQNFSSLSAVQQAAKIVPTLGLTAEKIERRHVALRSAAIRAFSLWDVKTTHRWSVDVDRSISAAFDFVNQRVAQSDDDGNILIREFGKTEIKFQLPTVGEHAWVNLFSPDGRFFLARYHDAVKMADPVVVLWDVESQEQILRLNGVSLTCDHCFSTDSSMFANCRNGKTIEVFAADTGQLMYSFKTEGFPGRIRFAKNNSQLIVTQNELKTIDFWSLEEAPKIVDRVSVESDVTSLDWNDTLGQLAVGMEHDIIVWPRDDVHGEPIRLEGHEDRVVQVKLHPLGTAVMSSAWDGTTRLFDLVTLGEVLRLEGRSLTFQGFDDTGCQIGYVAGLSEFGVWKLPEKIPVKMLISSGFSDKLFNVKFIPNRSDLLASATENGVVIWNHRQPQRAGFVPSGETSKVMFNSSGTHVYTCGKPGLRRWECLVDGEAGENDVTFKAGDPETIWEGDVRDFDLNDEKQLICFRTQSNNVKVLDLETNEIRDMGPHTRLARAQLSTDGRSVATFTWQGTGVKIWDAGSGEIMQDIAPNMSNTASAVSKESNTMVVVSGNRRTEWSTNDWSKVSDRRRVECDGWAGGAAYSPDGQMLAITYSRYVLQLVDAKSGGALALLVGPVRHMIGEVDWSDDGRFVAVSNRNQILVWDIQQVQNRLIDLKIGW